MNPFPLESFQLDFVFFLHLGIWSGATLVIASKR